MTLPELLNKYGVNELELRQVLDDSDMEYDFAELKEIPDSWEKILATHRGLKVLKKVKITSKNRNKKSLLNVGIGVVKRKLDEHGFIGQLDSFDDTIVSRDSDAIFNFREGEDDFLERQVLFIQVTTRGRRRATIVETDFLGTVNPENAQQIILLHPFFRGHCLPVPKGFSEDSLYTIFRFQLISPTDYVSMKIVGFSEVAPLDLTITDSLKDYFKESVKNRDWNLEESGRKISIGRYLNAAREIAFFEKIRIKEYRELHQEKLIEELPFFLKEWEYILGEALPIEEVNKSVQITSQQQLELWLEDYLPFPEFGGETLQEIAIFLLFEEASSLNRAAKILNKVREIGLLDEKKLSEMLSIIIEDIQEKTELIYYQDVFQMLGEQQVRQILEGKIDGKLYIEECLNGEVTAYDFEKISRIFPRLEEDLQREFLEELEFEDIENLLKGAAIELPITLSATIYNRFKKHIAKRLKFCAFDIEIRRERLIECGYVNELGAKVLRKRSQEHREDLSADLFQQFRKAEVIIGHNILDFDLPQLEVRFNVKIDAVKVWDTLKVELLLSPQASTHALKTTHTALEDAQHSLQLFFNQLGRIAFLEEAGLARIFPFIPKVFYKFILRIRQMHGWLNVAFMSDLQEELSDLLHVKKQSPLVGKVVNVIEALPTKNVLIVCPELIGRQLNPIAEIQFLGDELATINALIVEEKVKGKYQSTELLGAALLQFLEVCKRMGQLPKYALLSPYLKAAVMRDAAVTDICKVSEIPEVIKQGKWCMSAAFLKDEARFASDVDWHILEIGKEISELTDKKLLAEWTFEQFNELKGVEDIWVNFSGGKSFATLKKNQLITSGLPINDLDVFWVEKRDYDTYRVWGKQANLSVADYLPEAIYQQLNMEALGVDLKRIQPIVPIVSSRYLNYMNLIRLNPTTDYRDRYWVFQIQLMYKLFAEDEQPTVLFVQNKEEVEPLIEVVKAGEFYVPSREASLLRQLELLHQSRDSRKVSIQAIEDLEAVLSVNYIGPLQIILDSFDINEKWYSLQQSDLLKEAIGQVENTEENIATQNIDLTDNETTEDEEDDSEESDGNAPRLPLRNDITGLLTLQKPLVDYYKFIIHQNDPNNTLVLLDARLEDRFQIKKAWGCKSIEIRPWRDLELYNYALKLVHLSFPARIIKEDLELDVAESMEKIRKIFIDGDYPFYDYQIPYLKAILPAKDDLLVTLPTGGGKSILFQGPALYRSSLTRGLTLVITPLKVGCSVCRQLAVLTFRILVCQAMNNNA